MDEIVPGMLQPPMMPPQEDSRVTDIENQLRDANQRIDGVGGRVESMERYFNAYQEKDVQVEAQDGTAIGLRVLGIPAASFPRSLGFTATGNADGITSISAGYYKVGATGEFKKIEKKGGSGTNAYLVITSNWGKDPEIKIEISGAAKEIELAEATPFDATVTRVPIARLQGKRIEQLMDGNLLVSIWAIDGSVAYWAESTGGKGPAE